MAVLTVEKKINDLSRFAIRRNGLLTSVDYPTPVFKRAFLLLKRRKTMIKTRNVSFLKPGQDLRGEAKTGVSLHCHTLHSKEIMDFVPYYAELIPVISSIWRRELRRSLKMYGRSPDFKTGYWTPPLTGHQVFDMESGMDPWPR